MHTQKDTNHSSSEKIERGNQSGI